MNESVKRKERESGIELLRIIAMLLIIFAHGNYHLDVHCEGSAGEAEQILLSLGASAGVSVFFLITGYFMEESAFSIYKLAAIWGGYLFYTGSCFVLNGLHNGFHKVDMIQSFMPVASGANWFMSSYIILYAFLPFIKKSIGWFNRHRVHFTVFVGIGIFFFIVEGSVTAVNENSSNFIFAVLIVYVGAFIRHSELIRKIDTIKFEVFVIFIYICSYVLSEYSPYMRGWVRGHYTTRYGIFSVTVAVSLVVVFSRVQFTNRLINLVASTLYGVYLIHDNYLIGPILMRRVIRMLGFIDYTYAHLAVLERV